MSTLLKGTFWLSPSASLHPRGKASVLPTQAWFSSGLLLPRGLQSASLLTYSSNSLPAKPGGLTFQGGNGETSIVWTPKETPGLLNRTGS